MHRYLSLLITLPLSAMGTEEHWSLVPPKKTALPVVKAKGWPLRELDHFVLAKMEEQELTPSADVDTGSLVRRLSFDLTGLPPVEVPGEADFPQMVDALLKSPHFGERWGRHWLDMARYADSNGRDRNVIFYHAWRYRNYVIASFNNDKPYDEFIREQIAGDLMPAGNLARRDELLTATGFLALGAKALEEQKPEIYRMDVIDEQIEAISRSVLGLSVACARCHDHKFDPIPTADYYALAGILRSTQPLHGYGPRGIKATAHHHTEWHALGADAEKLAPAALAYFKKLDAEILAMHEARSARYGVSKRIPEKKRLLVTLTGAEKDKLATEIAEMEAKVADWNIKVAALEKSVEELKDAAPPQPAWAMGARDRDKPENSRIHIRGETTNLGGTVPRGFLRVISIKDVPAPSPKQSGRLELVQWLTHRDNPLTARVMVNRVWQKLFGRALVTTPDDFGITGARPSHPELLDFLAVRFMEEGWSVKWLVKEIVLSRAYRQSSARTHDADPDNVWLTRMTPRLIEAEALRDAVLAVSGQLDPYPPQKPFLDRYHPQRDAELSTFKPFMTTADLVDDHRSVYLPVVRGTLPEIFTLFNFAPPERPVAQREESTLPAQALHLMNNPWIIEQAGHLARRVTTVGTDVPSRLTRLYELAFARKPTEIEIRRASAFLGQNTSKERWTSLCQTVLASAEFRVLR